MIAALILWIKRVFEDWSRFPDLFVSAYLLRRAGGYTVRVSLRNAWHMAQDSRPARFGPGVW